MVAVDGASPPAECEVGEALERIRRWLLTEVADELKRPGKLKLTVNLNENRRDIKAVIERFLDLE
jgi:ribosomal protein L23